MLDLASYSTKKESDNDRGVDTSNVATKRFHCFESWNWQTR